MSNLNKVMLMGRLTRDPELRYTPQGTAVTDLGIAVNRVRGGRDGGERQEETTFVDVTAWMRQAEVICEYLHKGDPIFIEGRLTLDTWESREGEKRSKLKVVLESFQFIGGRQGGGGSGGDSYGGGRASSQGGERSGGGGATNPAYEYQGGGGYQGSGGGAAGGGAGGGSSASGGSGSQGAWDGGEPLDEKEIPF